VLGLRRIKIENWKARMPKYEEKGDSKKLIGYDEVEESLLIVLNNLMASKRPEEIPRGLDKFRIFNRLSKAFEKADKSKVLELEETDYAFLKEIIEKDIPSTWGLNENISKAVEAFLNAKEE